MCYKLVDDKIGKIICRLVIRSVTEPDTSNLCVDLIEPLPPDAITYTESDVILDELMTLSDLEILFSHRNEKDPIGLILTSIKSTTWQEIERSKQKEHREDLQQRHFHSS